MLTKRPDQLFWTIERGESLSEYCLRTFDFAYPFIRIYAKDVDRKDLRENRALQFSMANGLVNYLNQRDSRPPWLDEMDLLSSHEALLPDTQVILCVSVPLRPVQQPILYRRPGSSRVIFEDETSAEVLDFRDSVMRWLLSPDKEYV